MKVTAIPGYASNYTDEDEKLDFVFVIGKDNSNETTQAENYAEIKADCEAKGLKYAILGDGKKGVNLAEIAKLPNANNTVIYAHGGVRNEKHKFWLTDDGKSSNSLEIIHALQQQTNCKSFFIFSCYGGKISDDIQKSQKYKLQEDTSLAAYSAPDEVSWSNDAAIIHSIIMDNTTKGKEAPMDSITANIIKNIKQTMVLGRQQNGFHSVTLSRNSEHINHEAENFCAYQWKNYVNFIDKLLMSEHSANLKQTLQHEFPTVDFDDYIRRKKNNEDVKFMELNMSKEEIEQFEKNSIWKHVVHNDIEVLKVLLQHEPAVAGIMFDEIVRSRDNNKHFSGDVIRLYLAHRATQEVSNQRELNWERSNLSDLNLTGLNLDKVNLAFANLKGADLTGASMAGTDLSGADLRSAKGLTANMLINAASLVNTKIDAQQFKSMRNDDQVMLKKKIVNDNIEYLNKEDNIFGLASKLKEIIADDTHPLKYKRIGFDDYGNTTSSAQVINFGIEKLISQISSETNGNEITESTRVILQQIADAASADNLKAAIAQIPESTVDATSRIEKLPMQERLDYAKQITDQIQDIYDVIWVMDQLPEHDKLSYAKFTAEKMTDVADVKLVIERLPEKDKLDYAKYSSAHVKNIDNVISVIRRLPEDSQLDFAKDIVNKIENNDDLKWLVSQQKISGETKQFVESVIKKRIELQTKVTEQHSQSTLNIFARLIADPLKKEQALKDSSHHPIIPNTASPSPAAVKSAVPVNDAKIEPEGPVSERRFRR